MKYSVNKRNRMYLNVYRWVYVVITKLCLSLGYNYNV